MLYKAREEQKSPEPPEPTPEEYVTVGDHRYRLVLDSPLKEAARALREATLDDSIGSRRWLEDRVESVKRAESGRGMVVTVYLAGE